MKAPWNVAWWHNRSGHPQPWYTLWRWCHRGPCRRTEFVIMADGKHLRQLMPGLKNRVLYWIHKHLVLHVCIWLDNRAHWLRKDGL